MSMHTTHQRNGTTVTNAEHTSKAPRSATGLFALLGSVPHINGTSALETGQESGVSKAGRRLR
jgi:hypothetical protein